MTLALMALALGGGGLASPAVADPTTADTAAAPMSDNARQMAQWVMTSGDHRGLPFIVIDKTAAAVLVFDAQGQFIGSTPALLGAAHGDGTVVGIGDRELSAIRPDQRTTPAGRFLAAIGPAKGKSNVLWVDYASSLALHPVVPGTRKERRLERLRSPSPEDNRITYGCINISAAFYKDVIRTLLGKASGVVYILPETRPLNEVFPTFRVEEQPVVAANLGQ